MHMSAGTPAAIASAVLGMVVTVALWGAIDRLRLLAWAGSLALVLALRLGLKRLQAQSAAGRFGDGLRLRQYRYTILLHGLAWCFAAVLLLPQLDRVHADLLIFALVAASGGALANTPFDLKAAALFVVPVLAPLAWHFATAGLGSTAMAALVATFLVMMGGGAWRSWRKLRENRRLRLAESEGAAEVRRHAEMLDRIGALAHVGGWELDVASGQLRWSAQTFNLHGLDPAHQPTLAQALAYIAEPGRSRFEAALHAAQAQGSAFEQEILVDAQDGRQRAVRVICEAHAEEGQVTRLVGAMHDVTRLRQFDNSLRMYAMAVNSIDDMVSVAGEDEVYRMVNDAWCKRTGIAREQIIGKRLLDISPQVFDARRRPAILESLAQQMPITVSGMIALPALAGRFMQTTYYPYGEDEAGTRLVAIVTRDLTDQEQGRALLATQAEYLQRTLNATGEAIFASDAQNHEEPVRFVNERLLQMWGIPAHEATTLTPATIIRYGSALFVDAAAEVRRIDEIIAGQVACEDHLVLNDGRVLLRRCSPAQQGPTTVRVWSFRDITVQERVLQALRHSEAEQRALLDAFPGYIGAIDSQLRYTFVNDRLAAVLGHAPGTLIGRRVSEMLSHEPTAQFENAVHRALAGQASVFDRHYPATAERDALDLEARHVAGPVRPDGSQTCYLFGADITERKRGEAALIAARDEAQRASRAKSQFLSHMSHELRTPLNAVLGFAQLLDTDARPPLAPEHRAYTREILRGGRHLLSLINDVLDLGQIESGRLQLECVELPLLTVVKDCLSLVAPIAQERGVELLPIYPPDFEHQVLADPKRLKQVLLNLLGNAIKYNLPDGCVGLECSVQGQAVRLGVRDTGPGLTELEQARLFEAFERLGAEERAVEGTGIGLALSRHLMHAMGGDIGVQSQPGAGSVFWIGLPRARAGIDTGAVTAIKPPNHAPISTQAQHHCTVLYIEDNPVNVVLMEAMLAHLPGLRLLTAGLPLPGLQLAIDEQPDLILLDIQLPDIDGYEVLRRLRAAPGTEHIPVIAVSANAMESDIEQGLAAGFVAYLTKPLEMTRLIATVQQTLPAQVPGMV